MKTRQQREFEARIRAQQLAARELERSRSRVQEGKQDQSESDSLLEARMRNQRRNAVRERIDRAGATLPKRTYLSAAEHHYNYQEFWLKRHPRRILAHRSSPVDGSSLFTRDCEFDGCRRPFFTPARQRKFCSEPCARKDQRQKAAAARSRYESLTEQCAAEGCSERFFRLRENHQYCSSKCRDRSRDKKSARHQARQCEACEETFIPKSSRARFCSDRCRVRAWSRQKVIRQREAERTPDE